MCISPAAGEASPAGDEARVRGVGAGKFLEALGFSPFRGLRRNSKCFEVVAAEGSVTRHPVMTDDDEWSFFFFRKMTTSAGAAGILVGLLMGLDDTTWSNHFR